MLSDLISDWSRHMDPGDRSVERKLTLRLMRRVLATQGCWAVADYRFRRWALTLSPPYFLPFNLLGRFTRKGIEILTGISIERDADIGPGLYIGHFGGIFVGAVKMGRDCNISQGVTIGMAVFGKRGPGWPTIGDNVYIAPGAKIFGPISIGSGAHIGANAVVIDDVPPNATAVGVPARVIERQPSE